MRDQGKEKERWRRRVLRANRIENDSDIEKLAETSGLFFFFLDVPFILFFVLLILALSPAFS